VSSESKEASCSKGEEGQKDSEERDSQGGDTEPKEHHNYLSSQKVMLITKCPHSNRKHYAKVTYPLV
jgi:hypothetical protein